MKTLKFISLIAIISCLTFSCKEKVKDIKHDGYIIKGTVKGIDNVYIKMLESGSREPSEIKTIDSVKITNGKFEFKGKVDHVDMVDLVIDSKYNGRFMLENSPITLSIDVSELEGRNTRFEPIVSGSKSHDEFETIEAQSQAAFNNEKYKPLDELRGLFDAAKKDKENTALMDKAMAAQKELGPLMMERNQERISIKHDYARNNPSSPVAVHVLGYQYTEGRMTKEQLKEFYNLFEGDAKETGFFKYHITKVYKDNFENLGVGNTAPDFTLNTVGGESLTLSEVEGKYLLVDFWASWCVPCRASFPHLKELRNQYGKDGFTIVGIGTADKEDKWRKAIEEDQTPWIHVYDANTEGGNMYGPVAKKYAVPHLPTTFLVDANQTIVLRNPSKEELDDKLKELFGH